MSYSNYEVWKLKEVAERYLNGMRGAFPLAQEHIEIMIRIIAGCDIKIEEYLTSAVEMEF